MAGLGRRTFAAGEVLTAGNVMGYLQDQAVMAFAGTAARGSAIGTAVSEGMVSYLADNNVVQAYDGSAWNSLAYASSVITPGLVPIVPTTVTYVTGTGTVSTNGAATFTGCTAIQLNGVFTSGFANYKVVIGGTHAGAYGNIFVRLVSSGTVVNTNYVGGFNYIQYNSASFSITSTGSGEITFVPAFYDKVAASVDIYQPQQATGTKFSGTGLGSNSASGGYTLIGGEHNATTQFQGIYLGMGSGTFTGNVQVFGYND